MNTKKLIGLVVGILFIAVVFIIPVPAGATREMLGTLGIMFGAIVWLIFKTFPDVVSMILMCCLFVLFKCTTFPVAFTAFSSTTLWIIIGAMSFGAAGNKSGLLKRISLTILKLFPANFTGQAIGQLVAGTVVSPMIPSSTAKVAILAPLALGVSDAMGYEHKSPKAAGIFCAFFTGTFVLSPLFLSASAGSYGIIGWIPEPFKSQFNWGTWFISALPWGLVTFVLSAVVILFLFKPKNDAKIDSTFINEQIKALGPMKREEKITITIMLVSIVLWILENTIGVNSTVVALIALCLLIILGVMDLKDFNNMGWDFLLYIGGLITIGSVFTAVKVDTWIGGILRPYLSGFMSNTFLFIIVMAVIILALRMCMVSWFTPLTIFSVVLSPIAVQLGLNPWVYCFIVYTSVCVFVVPYQHVQYLTAIACTGDMFAIKDVTKFAVAYLVINVIGLLVSVPVWTMLGYIK